jgi:GTP-binding protein Era
MNTDLPEASSSPDAREPQRDSPAAPLNEALAGDPSQTSPLQPDPGSGQAPPAPDSVARRTPLGAQTLDDIDAMLSNSASVAAHADTTPKPAEADQRCGLVAIVGRPNVGKSTLLNALVGQKVSITSRKAQTTRHRIIGIRTEGDAQFVFVDTPGFQLRHTAALNRTLNRTVLSSLTDVDVVLFVVEAGRFGLDDAKVLALLPPDKPVLLIANKLDTVVRRADLAPWLKGMQDRHAFAEFVPLTAKKQTDVARLLGIVRPYLPAQPWTHDSEALTDRSERFLASELIREKLFRLTGDELPYTSTVVIDRFEEQASDDHGRMIKVAASIVVEREAHKGMVIGQGGEVLKRIGSEVRSELEKLMDAKVFVELWVKVRSGWAADEDHLRSYGYE